MKIINLRQGTEEWYTHRRKHHNASEASILMGAFPSATRDDLLRKKSTGQEKEVTDWVQRNILDRGHAIEAAARAIAERIIGEELFPVTAVDDDDWLSASFDGQTMLGDINWECKQWSEAKAEDVRSGRIPSCDYWQLQHQFAVNPDSKTLYMVTDGTEERTVYIWVEPDKEAIAKLRTAWKQFEEDLAEYTPEPAEKTAEGSAPGALPALSIQVTGMVTASNLEEFESAAMAMLGSIKTELETDQDFADAEKTVKFLSRAEKDLETAKASALQQTATIHELFSTIDRLKDEMRSKRLYLNKLVKNEKERRKAQILGEAVTKFRDWLDKQDCPVRIDCEFDPAAAARHKKTLSALQAAVDQAVADAKVQARQIIERVNENHRIFSQESGEYDYLFPDWEDLIQKDRESMVAIIRSRIQEHKDAEQKKMAKAEKMPVPDQDASSRTIMERVSTTAPARERIPSAAELLSTICLRLDSSLIEQAIADHYQVSTDTAANWIMSAVSACERGEVEAGIE